MYVAPTNPEEDQLMTDLRRLVVLRHGSLRGHLAREVRAAIQTHVQTLQHLAPGGSA